MLTILITGKYDPNYNRNLVLFTGLKKMEGIRLIEFPIKNRKRSEYQKVRDLSRQADIVYLPAFTHLDVPKIKKYTDKPVFFDPLISRYLSKVFDYKTVWKYSPRGYKNYLKDKRAFRYSDFILADTYSHKEYFINTFDIPPGKIGILPVGVLKDLFYKMNVPRSGKTFVVGFFGSFLPLHGVDKILQAATLLRHDPRIEFRMYGHGRLLQKMKKKANSLKLDNLSFMGYLNYGDINYTINSFDLCLGIFGSSLKARIVIPNKIYHYAACGKPILTMDTEGIREIFTGGHDILLCESTGESIADSIMHCLENEKSIHSIGLRAMQKIREQFNEDQIANTFVSLVKSRMAL